MLRPIFTVGDGGRNILRPYNNANLPLKIGMSTPFMGFRWYRQVVHRLPYPRNLPIFIAPDFQLLIVSCSEIKWIGGFTLGDDFLSQSAVSQ